MEILYDLYLFKHGRYDKYIKIPSLTMESANKIAHDWIYKDDACKCNDDNPYGYLNDYYLVTTDSTPWPSPPKVMIYDDSTNIDFNKIKELLDESGN